MVVSELVALGLKMVTVPSVTSESTTVRATRSVMSTTSPLPRVLN
jgi:hypothetical protein